MESCRRLLDSASEDDEANNAAVDAVGLEAMIHPSTSSAAAAGVARRRLRRRSSLVAREHTPPASSSPDAAADVPSAGEAISVEVEGASEAVRGTVVSLRLANGRWTLRKFVNVIGVFFSEY